ncbi:MAG: helix-turn-helix domain-containing protein [bacterium]|nr:helix-turn-helix domain-containing protein [bacterium]
MDKEYLLNSVGLSEKEAKTYLAILELGSSTVKPISVRAGTKRTSIYNFIDHLVTLGLISQTSIHGRMHYKAESPEKLVELQRERTERLESALPEFLSLYNDNAKKPKISYFEGPEQVRNIGREALNCTKEACYIWPGPEFTEISGGAAFWKEIGIKRTEKGILSRLIRFHGKENLYEGSESGLEMFRETRWGPEKYQDTVDVAISIFDSGKVGIFGARQESFGILIESKALEKTMKMLFELLWEKSTPAKPGEG